MKTRFLPFLLSLALHAIKTGSGALSIEHKAFRSQNNIKYHIPHSEKITTPLRSSGWIRAYTPPSEATTSAVPS